MVKMQSHIIIVSIREENVASYLYFLHDTSIEV